MSVNLLSGPESLSAAADRILGTYEQTEVTAHTVLRDQNGLTPFFVKPQRLMASVPAGEVTAAASNTSISAETRIDDGIPLQIVQINDVFHRRSDQLRYAAISTLAI